jgi:hypothetical protein
VFENSDVLDTTIRTDDLTEAYALEFEADGTCDLSSTDSDILTYVSGTTWKTADLNKYVRVTLSVLGNNTEDLRIIELLDETSPSSGVWNQIRLENASFITESGVSWQLRAQTTNRASSWNAGTGIAMFSTTPEAIDQILFGHKELMWDRFDVVISSATPSIIAVWEFYDPSETTIHPESVVKDPVGFGGHLQFRLDALLGLNIASNALVRVMHVPTGVESNALSTTSGGYNVVNINGYLGQSSPSTVATDYLVFAEWRPVSVLTDTTKPGSATWEQSGYTEFTLPQNQTDNWQKYTFYDKNIPEEREAYFLRYRVCSNSGAAAAPVPQAVSFTSGERYVLYDAVQGKTVEDDPLGSSSGDANQEFRLLNSPYIYQTIRVFIDEGGGDIEWEEVETFLTSYSIDRHFIVDVQTDGSAILKFGDGINGRIPPLGTNNIRAIYRIGADEDGNIGANTLTVNRDGVGVFKQITNPRSGEFWVEADWNSQDALERVKQAGPLNLRTMLRGMTARDVEILAQSFVNTDGVKPVARAKAYEEAFGPKTLELVVAGGGGAALTSTYRSQLEEFFNGGENYGGVLIANHEVTVTNYSPKLIGYTVEVTAYSVVTETLVLQTLSSLISPTAVEDDKVTFVWEFGQEVPNSRVIAEIFKISPGNVFKVVITTPSSDVSLTARELPVLDAANTTITIVSPVV